MNNFNENPWVVTFSPQDTRAQKLKKAAHVCPSPAQLRWMEREWIAFVHYGPDTFNHVQWGNGTEQLDDFSPKALDVAQWCRVCAQTGMKMMVYVAKHHDGFCQWHSDTTDFNVKNAQKSEDVLRSLQLGCRENGIELGVYLSPWDMHQRTQGLWPTEAYNDYFLSQLQELLTRYGEIGEVWFDGACSDFPIWTAVPTYAPRKWYDMIAQLQPQAVCRLYDPYEFASEAQWDEIRAGRSNLRWDGKAVRWVGNEGGMSRENEWSVQPVFDRRIAENATWKDLGEEKYYDDAVGAIWYPLEVNTVVLNQWFWNEGTSHPRSLADLVEVYYHSIGNNGVLLLNVSPNTEGVLGEDQVKRLQELRQYVDETFASNFAQGAQIPGAQALVDGDPMTFWSPEGDWDLDSRAELTITLDGEQTFDQVLVQEFIREGQRVAGWALDVWTGDEWKEVACHKTIGYKTIRRFPRVTASRVRLRIERSWDVPMLSGFGLYLSAPITESQEETLAPFTPTPAKTDDRKLEPGLAWCSYDGGVQSAALLDGVFAVMPMESGIAGAVRHEYAGRSLGYCLTFDGYMQIPADGEYTFEMENADGGMVYLGGSLLLNNDEPHECSSTARTVSLKQGIYALAVRYTSFRNNGQLRLRWAPKGEPLCELGAEDLLHERSE